MRNDIPSDPERPREDDSPERGFFRSLTRGEWFELVMIVMLVLIGAALGINWLVSQF